MQIQSPQQIINILNKYNKKTILISFDVFDTLLRRSIAPPERAKIPLLKKLKKILAANEINISLESLINKRNKTEMAIGNSMGKMGFDWD